MATTWTAPHHQIQQPFASLDSWLLTSDTFPGVSGPGKPTTEVHVSGHSQNCGWSLLPPRQAVCSCLRGSLSCGRHGEMLL